jgi:hypothetical protein
LATRFYLYGSTPAAFLPTTGEKSTANPVGTLNNFAVTNAQENRTLTLERSLASSSQSIPTLAQTADQDAYITRHTSDRSLAAQTISANTWTCGLQIAEDNAAANAFMMLSIYVWRPSGSSVVGFVYDSHTALGTEVDGTGQIYSVSGGSVTAAAGDVLVLEVWEHATQSMAVIYNLTFTFGVGADVTAGAGNVPWLETPQNLLFLAPPPLPPYPPHTLPLLRM